MVVSAVCILLQENASSWTIARQVMSDPQFLKRLMEIDKDAIPEQVSTVADSFYSVAAMD
jgi:dynein heavy chain, axonemal